MFDKVNNITIVKEKNQENFLVLFFDYLFRFVFIKGFRL